MILIGSIHLNLNFTISEVNDEFTSEHTKIHSSLPEPN